MTGPHGYSSLFSGCVVVAVLMLFVVVVGIIATAVAR